MAGAPLLGVCIRRKEPATEAFGVVAKARGERADAAAGVAPVHDTARDPLSPK